MRPAESPASGLSTRRTGTASGDSRRRSVLARVTPGRTCVVAGASRGVGLPTGLARGGGQRRGVDFLEHDLFFSQVLPVSGLLTLGSQHLLPTRPEFHAVLGRARAFGGSFSGQARVPSLPRQAVTCWDSPSPPELSEAPWWPFHDLQLSLIIAGYAQFMSEGSS